MNRLGQFWHYAERVFGLPSRLRGVRDQRVEPQIPSRVLSATLFLAALLRVPSLLQLQAETGRKGWQRLVGWKDRISDDALGYALERYRLEDLRSVLVESNKTLKRNKAFESAKIGGLLAVAVDANEQFKSRHRCCRQCSQRTIEFKDADGQVQTCTEYFHRQVYAQLHGPEFSVILDLEPIRPGEGETAAALRLLGRMRRLYGPRFFDVVTADALYATAPFIKAVRRLGWSVVTVLKQERYEIYQEATRLSAQVPVQNFQWEGRQVQIRQVQDLSLADPEAGSVRVVLADEEWTEKQRLNGQMKIIHKKSHWRWVADASLESSSAEVIHGFGHQRWGVENHAFNELTQYYHLTHCPRHDPTAILAWLLFRVLGFNFFELFVRLHGKLWRAGRLTLQQAARELDSALEHLGEFAPLWSG